MHWLVNTGTREDPWLDRLVERYRMWNDQYGDVQMFPCRPREMAVGDLLIHRIVGSPDCELVAVGEIVVEPHASGNERWPWQVERRLLHVCETLAAAPSAERAGIAAKGLRVMKRLEDEQGKRAMSLIVASGRPFTQVY